ncbi:AIR synthase-related protein [Acinetobacter baylyi]|nr:AIR synthase-related protein [Acinetobacter baylyi]
MSLNQLLEFLRHTPAMLSKQAIAESVSMPNVESVNTLQALYAYPGDDTAAVAIQDQYLLHACEGMLPSFVANYPYFAGWSAVMANVSDIAAMGGETLSIVNSIWHHDTEQAQLLMQGMQDACTAYGVALVGGHSNIGHYQPTLSVAIQGTAQKLLSIFHVKPQQKILIALNLNGQFHPNTVYWKCFEKLSGHILQAQLSVLPHLAAQGLAHAARDISNAGILGSLLMLLEATQSGANINLDCIPKPQGVEWETWLQIFPSYGFLLTADEDKCQDIIELFESQDICCAAIGESNATSKVQIRHQQQSDCFWDFQQQRFTGFDYADILKKLIAYSSSIEQMSQEATHA